MAFESVIGKKLADVKDELARQAGKALVVVQNEGEPPQVMPSQEAVIVTLNDSGTITAVRRSLTGD